MKLIANYKAIIAVIVVALVFSSVRFAFGSGVFQESKVSPVEEINYIGSSSVYKLENEEKFLLIEGHNIHRNELIKEVLLYQNKQYDIAGEEYSLENYDVVIYAEDDCSLIDETFEEYVANGGGLLIASGGLRFWEDDLFEISQKGNLVEQHGIRAVTNALMSSEGDEYTSSYFNVIGSYFDYSDDFTVHLETMNGMPLLLSRDYGEGNFVMYNSSLIERKTSMSVLVSALTLTKDFYIYPTYNSFQVHVDDWVSPVPPGDYEYSTGRIVSLAEVYRQDWWPWMIRLGKDLNLEYTMLIIGNYMDTTTGIGYDYELTSIENNSIYLLEAITNGYEVGIHGQNHQSLLINEKTYDIYGYNTWIDWIAMKNAINYLETQFNAVYPEYALSSYVPPSNSMDEEGYKAIVEAMENLKAIGSVFDDDNNELVYSQYYHIDENDIAHFPRHTAGYIRSELMEWTALNGVVTTGVFSHFIHPDDLIDPARSYGFGISEMKDSFESFITDMHYQYIYLNKNTLTEGYNQIVAHDNARVNIETGESITIHIDELYDGVGFFVKADRISSIEGASLFTVDSMTYFIVPNSVEVIIHMGE